MLRVGIIGAGIIAHHHLNALMEIPEMEAVAIAEIDSDKAQDVSLRYGVKAYNDYKEMIIAEAIDIVVISLPHFLHKECALYCAQHGCHLLLEKPMALNSVECQEIIDAVEHNHIKLMVGHTQHYIPENRVAKQLIEQGTLGDLIMINDIRHKFYFTEERPRWFLDKALSGGGIFMNLGSHSIDKIQWLTSSRIAKVHASLSFHGDQGNIEGSGIVYVETNHQIPAVIYQSGYHGVPREETELVFTKGMMKLQTNDSLWISQNGQYEKVEIHEPVDPYVMQFRDFLQHIESGIETDCTGEYAMSVVSAVEAIYHSHETQMETIVEERGLRR